MEHYNNLPEAIEGLKKTGYVRDFNLGHDCIICSETKTKLYPDQFTVDAFHRFEELSSTDDNSIIYAITLSDGTKGTLINAYGVYADEMSVSLQKKFNATEYRA